jgi:peroxiredoxin
MAVESTDNLIGKQLPSWELPDTEGRLIQVKEPGHQATLVTFVRNHCPYVKHVEVAFREVVTRHLNHGLRTLAVVSNDVVEYPEDDMAGMMEQAARAGWDFPYLMDRNQQFAIELGAVCTPDFFLFDADFHLTYRGAFDNSSPKNGNPVSGELLEDAIVRTLAGNQVPLPHRPSMGCSIKWLPGNEHR